MNTLFITQTYLPKYKGGTELYLRNLALNLKNAGCNIYIVCLEGRDNNGENYIYENCNVIQCTYKNKSDIFNHIQEVISLYKIQIIHFQGFNGHVDCNLLDRLSVNKIPIFYTLHLFNNFCKNNGFLKYKNKYQCNGIVDISKCQTCIFSNTILPKYYSSYLFNAFIHEILPYNISSKIFSKNHFQIRSVLDQIAILKKNKVNIIVFNEWTSIMMNLNGITNTTVISQGIRNSIIEQPFNKRSKSSINEFIWTYLGRLSEEKGIKELILSFKKVATKDDKLNILSNLPSELNNYQLDVLNEINNDSRISLLQGLSDIELVEAIDKSDCIVIPSKVAETGPMVLFEAIARKKILIVSNYIMYDVVKLGIGTKFSFDIEDDFSRKMLQIKNTYQLYNYENIVNIEINSVNTMALQHLRLYKDVLYGY